MKLPCRVGVGGGYSLTTELGRGGMGVVYLGRDLRLDREVAIKALPVPVAGEPERMERLRQEARLLATVNHPNVAQIYSLEEWEGAYYLVLEYVPGQSLGEYSRGWFSLGGGLAEMLGLLAQVARGVEAAHSRGLVHRDLKPDNIRITPAPARVAKVLDFGLAKLVPATGPVECSTIDTPNETETLATIEVRHRDTAAPPERTRHGVIMGSPGFMSPEQARGQPADQRADVWALGCVFYEALTGRRAFPGATLTDSLAATLLGEPDWSLLPAALSEEVRGLLKRSLIKDRSQRTVEAHELRVALERACSEGASTNGVAGALATSSVGIVDSSAPERTSAPTNLPRQLTTFVGRGEQVTEIKRLVGNSVGGVVTTLVGSAGCGKTRLAHRVAEELLGTFPDGVWMVELAGVSGGRLVVGAIASELGIRDDGGSPLMDRLVDGLRNRRMLVVLDNCEHVLGETAATVEKVVRQCHGVRVLATSREALGTTGEVVWKVPSLSLPKDDGLFGDSSSRGPGTTFPNMPGRTPLPGATARAAMHSEAVVLFLERARSAKPGFALGERDAVTVAQICRRLDGIPLAIELAAAKAKMLSIEQIAKRLEDQFRLLAGGSRTSLERHQTLRAAIDWSIRLLTDDERKLLMRLSVFWGGFDLEAVESICPDGSEQPSATGSHGLSAADVLDTLSRLVDKSMVAVEDAHASREGDCSPRYRLLESVRQRAVEMLAAEIDDAALALRDRHQNYFAGLAGRARLGLRRERQQSWLEALDIEHDNLVAAIHWGSGGGGGKDGEGGEGDRAERSLSIVADLSDYWFTRGQLTLGRSLTAEALGQRACTAEVGAIGRAQVGLGVLARAQGDLEGAAAALHRGLEHSRLVGDRRCEASALVSLGNVDRQKGLLESACERYDEALRIRRAEKDEPGEADALMNLGVVARQRGALNLARDLYERARTIYQREGNRLALSRICNNLGTVAEDAGDLDTADTQYERSVRLCRECGNAPGLALASSNLGGVAVARGQPARAAALLAEAMEIRRSLADRGGLAMSLEAITDLAILGGEHARAVRLTEAAMALREATGMKRSARREAQIAATMATCRATLGEGFEGEVRAAREAAVESVVAETLTWLDARPTL